MVKSNTILMGLCLAFGVLSSALADVNTLYEEYSDCIARATEEVLSQRIDSNKEVKKMCKEARSNFIEANPKDIQGQLRSRLLRLERNAFQNYKENK
jgi:hypothetical protein